VIRGVHKFDFRLVINEKNQGHTVLDSHVFTRCVCFSRPIVSSHKRLPLLCRSAVFSWV